MYVNHTQESFPISLNATATSPPRRLWKAPHQGLFLSPYSISHWSCSCTFLFFCAQPHVARRGWDTLMLLLDLCDCMFVCPQIMIWINQQTASVQGAFKAHIEGKKRIHCKTNNEVLSYLYLKPKKGYTKRYFSSRAFSKPCNRKDLVHLSQNMAKVYNKSVW